MAKQESNTPKPKGVSGWISASRWFAPYEHADHVADTHEQLGDGYMDTASLFTAGYDNLSEEGALRNRQQIYAKWTRMEAEAIVSAGIRWLVTASLGGHETSGDVVFIESRDNVKSNEATKALVDEIKNDVTKLFNRIAFPIAYRGCTFGDAYSRNYAVKKKGLVDVLIDEMVKPQMVIPYEQGNKTRLFLVSSSKTSSNVKLSFLQMSRLKMPRLQDVPQVMGFEKWMKANIQIDDVNDLKLMPSLAGGSFLYPAEAAFDDYRNTLTTMVGQRLQDSIDEQMYTVNAKGMTESQKKKFLTSVSKMIKYSQALAMKVLKVGATALHRVRYIFPVSDEKQLVNITPTGSERNTVISDTDVMFHAKRVAGGLGLDISLTGFADIMSGGLGEGGFSITSAQAAERARMIRTALTDYFNDLIDVHTYYKYGWVMPENDRPWTINFYSAIAALESKQQSSKSEAINGSMLMVQTMQSAKDLGMDEKQMETLMSKHMRVDEEEAKLFAKVVNAKTETEEGGGFGEQGGDHGAF